MSFVMNYKINEEPIRFSDIKFPNTLYKYRNWEKDDNKTILTKREVFFAPPISFTDQYDCKISKRWDLLTHEDILNKYYQDSLERNKHFTSIEDHMLFAIKWANNTNIKNEEYLRVHQAKEFVDYNDRSGVLSLTEFCDLKEMWEMYCDNHKGFCVGFDPKIMLQDMGTAGGKVIYYPELPIIYPSPKHSFSLQMHLQVFSKLNEWEFEQEYRTYKFRYEPLSLKDRKEIVPVEAFKEIILGAGMPEDMIEDLLTSLSDELRNIKIKKARIDGENIIIDDYKP